MINPRPSMFGDYRHDVPQRHVVFITKVKTSATSLYLQLGSRRWHKTPLTQKQNMAVVAHSQLSRIVVQACERCCKQKTPPRYFQQVLDEKHYDREQHKQPIARHGLVNETIS
jgi:hypothetical protein